jgi:nitronate monooxygenase
MRRELLDLLGISEPIVLGPFGGLSSVDLVAIISEAGGLGSYGLYGYGPDRIRETTEAIRAATSRAFALNVWHPLADDERNGAGAGVGFAEAAAAMGELFRAAGVEPPQAPPERYLPTFDEQWSAVLDAAPTAVSVVYGVPDAASVSAAHSRGIVVIGTATTVQEAAALQGGGVDAIVATGFEAAGHRVSFLRPPQHSLVGTFALIPQVRDAVSVPVIAAGGIADRRGVAAAFALGADAVQVGTAFLRTRQSAATEGHRRAIASTAADHTVLTRAMSGRLARGASNRAIRTIEKAAAIAPFPVQNWLTGQFRAAAARTDLADLQSLWMGQASALATRDDARDVFAESPGAFRTRRLRRVDPAAIRKRPAARAAGLFTWGSSADVRREVLLEGELRLRADDRRLHLTALEHLHRRDRRDLVLHRQVGVLIDVQLENGDLLRVLGLDLVEHGRNHATRSAPCCPEVDQDGAIGLENVLVPRVRVRRLRSHCLLLGESCSTQRTSCAGCSRQTTGRPSIWSASAAGAPASSNAAKKCSASRAATVPLAAAVTAWR